MIQITTHNDVAVRVDSGGTFRAQVGDLPLAAQTMVEIQKKIDAELRRLRVIAEREERKKREPCTLWLFDNRTGEDDPKAVYEGILKGDKKKDYDTGHVVRFKDKRDNFDTQRFSIVRAECSPEDVSRLHVAMLDAQKANKLYAEMRRLYLAGNNNYGDVMPHGVSVGSRTVDDPDERSKIEEDTRERIRSVSTRPIPKGPSFADFAV